MTPDEVEGLGLRNIQKRRFQRVLSEARRESEEEGRQETAVKAKREADDDVGVTGTSAIVHAVRQAARFASSSDPPFPLLVRRCMYAGPWSRCRRDRTDKRCFSISCCVCSRSFYAPRAREPWRLMEPSRESAVLQEAALLPLLTKHQLHAYSDLAGVLRNLADLGVEGPTDLAEMTPDEVEGLGLRNIQKRRFQRMLDEARGESEEQADGAV